MKVQQIINAVLEKVLIFLMSILVLDVLWQVCSRYLLSSPSSFTDELAGFLLIWVGVLGAAYVSGKNQHLAIDLLKQKVSPMLRKNIDVVINVLVALFAFLVMLVGGTWLVITRFQLDVNSAALHMPLGFVYLVMPISGLLIIFYSVLLIIHPKKESI